MAKTYQCPNCNGTKITWDRGLRKAVCPKDKTPLSRYKIENETPSSREFGIKIIS